MAKQGMMPAEICTRMNDALAGDDNKNSMFVTFFIGLVNLSTGHLDFCNAGHNPPVIGSNEDDTHFLDMIPNMPIGLFPDFNYVGESLDNIKGEWLFVYTDGLNEAENTSQEQFGDELLLNTLRATHYESSRQVVETLEADVEQHRNGAEPNDDLTMMCLHVMKRLLVTIVAILTLAACGTQGSQGGYTINGTAKGTVDGDTVLLCDEQGFLSIIPVDTAIIKDGKFQFTGEQEGAVLRLLMPLHDGKPTTMEYFTLENAVIIADLGLMSEHSHFELGPNGQLFLEFLSGDSLLSAEAEPLWKVIDDSTAAEADKVTARQKMDSLQAIAAKKHKKFIIDHVPSAISDMLFGRCMQEFNEQEQEEILKILGEKQPDFPVYKAIMEERKANESTAVGARYTDIRLPAPDGKFIRVSDFVAKNRLTLIDFWASWCGPCRAEMPSVVKAYTAYHQKGFEVVGVSLDKDKDAWLKAIDQLKMPWPQMSDLKGWESEGAALYNVRSIPSNVLIDQQGNIVAKDLRGEDLANKVGELLN